MFGGDRRVPAHASRGGHGALRIYTRGGTGPGRMVRPLLLLLPATVAAFSYQVSYGLPARVARRLARSHIMEY